ncbi:ParB/RepB/Spo0J family partition protein [[Clostridium] symbiosum]|uniref:ParB/RepB/Spo0J family partition protein n=1 Tax=Clostridium symbiosum TaxID=1512 RepID=UPI0018977069|nr:ParB/RepB/Spo0J family partition protein [[Clostridium] symbiosum]MDB2017037.1 ParB/RepB/Spo0J family partition protein [[Clostridium] symbiosum]
MAKFDLHQLLNERSKAAAVERTQEPHPAESMEQLTLDVYDLIPSKENFYSVEYINDLKQSISLVGVLQPLLVKRDGDKYRIKAGHRRRLACMALADEGQEKFRFVPCVIRQEAEEEKTGNVNTILDRLMLIFANGFREKTDWEKMEEALQTEALVLELRKEISLEGRTRSILAEFTGIKEAQLGRYKAIKNNLCPQLMAEFKANNINISTVYELSGLSSEYQQRACEMYMENGILSISDAKTLKKQEEAAQQIPGQMEWPERETPARQQEETEEEEYQEEEETEQEEVEETAQEAQERPQEREKEVREDDNTQEAENRQETPQEQPQVVYVERQTEKQHGCAFCHPQHHREVSTAEGGFLLAYEPEGHTVQVINKETGIVESIVFHCCPMCGRKLV